jgi:hypothetical protein
MLETVDDRLLDSLLIEEMGALLLDWLELFPDDPPPHPQSVIDSNNIHSQWYLLQKSIGCPSRLLKSIHCRLGAALML